MPFEKRPLTTEEREALSANIKTTVEHINLAMGMLSEGMANMRNAFDAMKDGVTDLSPDDF